MEAARARTGWSAGARLALVRHHLLAAIALLLLLSAAEFVRIEILNGGVFAYPLDDSYILMATAKNLAQHGVWGITRHEFSSANSGLLSVLLLAGAYRASGVHELSALAISLAFSALALIAADRILKRYLAPGWRLLALTAVLVLAPLHIMALTGMEPALQITLALLFVGAVLRVLEEGRGSFAALALAPIAVLTRYESLFLIAAAALLLLARRRWMTGLLLPVVAALPVIVYGAISTSRGWYWLPNPLALKGAPTAGFRWATVMFLIEHLGDTAVRGKHILAPALLLATCAFFYRRTWWKPPAALALLASLTAALQLTLADVGWVYRYEAWIVALEVVAMAVALAAQPRPHWESGWLAQAGFLLALAFLAGRAATATIRIGSFSHAIYSQQFQMAEFLARYYNGASVAANDIGAINYRADLRCLDLVGLANRTIFWRRRAGSYTTEVIQAEAARYQTRLAIVYEDAFAEIYGAPKLPHSWTRVCRWKVADRANLSGDTVSFFAIPPEEIARLRERLKEFTPSLPPGVSVAFD